MSLKWRKFFNTNFSVKYKVKSSNFWNQIILAQECIPVGCVPLASMVISTGGCVRGGGVCPWGYTPLPDPEADTPSPDSEADTLPPPYPIACWDTHPPLPNACWDTHLACEQNDRCKNIALPQTSFTGGNNTVKLDVRGNPTVFEQNPMCYESQTLKDKSLVNGSFCSKTLDIPIPEDPNKRKMFFIIPWYLWAFVCVW